MNGTDLTLTWFRLAFLNLFLFLARSAALLKIFQLSAIGSDTQKFNTTDPYCTEEHTILKDLIEEEKIEDVMQQPRYQRFNAPPTATREQCVRSHFPENKP